MQSLLGGLCRACWFCVVPNRLARCHARLIPLLRPDTACSAPPPLPCPSLHPSRPPTLPPPCTRAGVEQIYGLGELSDYEKAGLKAMMPELRASIEKGIQFAKDNA